MTGAVIAPVLAVTVLAVTVFAAGASAADHPELTPAEFQAIRDGARDLRDRAQDARQPLPAGEVKVLRAVVMMAEGRAQWRAKGAGPYKAAKVDDILEPGAMIRTGQKSKLVLRVGHNATVSVDRQTRVVLPEMVQAGATLRTAVELIRGRADVKVDRVELTNDFSVVTPSTTLAVRGTGLGVGYGGFRGTDVFSARTNELTAIEVRYFLSRFSYLLSAGDRTSSVHQNPAIAALFDTIGPPPLITALIEDEETVDELADALSRSPIVDQTSLDQAMQGLDDTLGDDVLQDDDDDDDPPDPMGPDAALAEFICMNLSSIFAQWESLLNSEEIGSDGLDEAQAIVQAFCGSIPPGGFSDDDLATIMQEVNDYCVSQHDDMTQNFFICVDAFNQAVEAVENPPG